MRTLTTSRLEKTMREVGAVARVRRNVLVAVNPHEFLDGGVVPAVMAELCGHRLTVRQAAVWGLRVIPAPPWFATISFDHRRRDWPDFSCLCRFERLFVLVRKMRNTYLPPDHELVQMAGRNAQTFVALHDAASLWRVVLALAEGNPLSFPVMDSIVWHPIVFLKGLS